jgi:TM2 domain-containing membrane protein YozV
MEKERKRFSFVAFLGWLCLILFVFAFLGPTYLKFSLGQFPNNAEITQLDVTLFDIPGGNNNYNYSFIYNTQTEKILEILNNDTNINMDDLNNKGSGKKYYDAYKNSEIGIGVVKEVINPNSPWPSLSTQTILVKGSSMTSGEWDMLGWKYSDNPQAVETAKKLEPLSKVIKYSAKAIVILLPLFVLLLLIKWFKGKKENRKIEIKKKKFITALLLSIFLGYFGIDRFYLGKTGTGILKLILLFLWIGLIWWIIDIILIAMRYQFKGIEWVPEKVSKKEYLYRCQHCKRAFDFEEEAKEHLKNCSKRNI